mgnify:CR=1 FL=1
MTAGPNVRQLSAVMDRRYSINIAPLRAKQVASDTDALQLVDWLKKIIAAKSDEIVASKIRLRVNFASLAERARRFPRFRSQRFSERDQTCPSYRGNKKRVAFSWS